jgi:hypothetical protein
MHLLLPRQGAKRAPESGRRVEVSRVLRKRFALARMHTCNEKRETMRAFLFAGVGAGLTLRSGKCVSKHLHGKQNSAGCYYTCQDLTA